MSNNSFFSLERTRLRAERLLNLLLFNSFLGSSFPQSEIPYKIFVNSIPKSGTNLLMKTLSLFPTVRDSKISLHSEMAGTPWRPSQLLRRQIWNIFPSVRASHELAKSAIVSDEPLPNHATVGGFHDVYVPCRSLEKLLSRVRVGWFAAGHMPFSNCFDRTLVENNFRMLLIIRDPRDVVNSELNFFLNREELALHGYYQGLSREDGLMSIIRGIPGDGDYPAQPNIRDLLSGYLPWRSKPYVYVTTFEDLVGPRGGGNARAQAEEIRAIANHLELTISYKELAHIKNNAFGGTHTFRKGIIGAWQQTFGREHRLACKELIGDLLIQLGYEDDFDW